MYSFGEKHIHSVLVPLPVMGWMPCNAVARTVRTCRRRNDVAVGPPKSDEGTAVVAGATRFTLVL